MLFIVGNACGVHADRIVVVVDAHAHLRTAQYVGPVNLWVKNRPDRLRCVGNHMTIGPLVLDGKSLFRVVDQTETLAL